MENIKISAGLSALAVLSTVLCVTAIKNSPLSDGEPPQQLQISENYVLAEYNAEPETIPKNVSVSTESPLTVPEINIKPKIASESMRYSYAHAEEDAETNEEQKNAVSADASSNETSDTASGESSSTAPALIVQHGNYTDYRDKVKKYQSSLPDVYGYLDIPNTRVSYPVMLAPPDKPYDYYLSKDIYGNYEYAGSIFLDQYSAVKPANEGEKDILQIYGHNMANGSMFAGLNKFKDTSYASSNPYFSFSTADKAYACTIIAVAQVNDDEVLDVYRYDYPWQSAEQLATGWNKILGQTTFSADDIKNKMDSGIEYMILHTCSSYVYGKKVANGRFIVLAECMPK